MFVDKARIYIKAGKGGDGCVSFRREKFVPLGGPNGGSGGKGGDVIFRADYHLKTLLDLQRHPHYHAKDGDPGLGKNMYGHQGEGLLILVPVGTVVKSNNKLIKDFVTPGEEIIIAAGGRGGRGNLSFKTSRNRAPRIAERGEPGQEIVVDLELKLIADVGLIGCPNAGKSTFLSIVSAAQPKIADYPFTTLSPNLGVCYYGGKSFVIADIPGLIEGAHSGKGLGDDFLRHIERTRVLVHLVDIFGYDNKSPIKNFNAINKELSAYDSKLAKKPMLVVANKMDLYGADEQLKVFKRKLKKVKIYSMSAVKKEGVPAVLLAVTKLLSKAPKEEKKEEKNVVYHHIEPDFRIEKQDGVFVVTGKKIEKLAAMTNYDHEEAVTRTKNIFKKMGLDRELVRIGILPGDTVKIGDYEFEYENREVETFIRGPAANDHK